MAWSNRRFYDGDCKESFVTLKTFYLAIPCYSEIPPIWGHVLIPRGLSYLGPPHTWKPLITVGLEYLEALHTWELSYPGIPHTLIPLIAWDPTYLESQHTPSCLYLSTWLLFTLPHHCQAFWDLLASIWDYFKVLNFGGFICLPNLMRGSLVKHCFPFCGHLFWFISPFNLT